MLKHRNDSSEGEHMSHKRLQQALGNGPALPEMPPVKGRDEGTAGPMYHPEGRTKPKRSGGKMPETLRIAKGGR